MSRLHSYLLVSLLSLVPLVSGAGCHKKHAAAADCAGAFANARKVALAAQPAGMTPTMKQGLERAMDAAQESGLEQCKAERWSAATTDCIKQATSPDDLKSCLGTLTPAQRAAMRRATPRMKKLAPAGIPHPSPGEGAGSAAAGAGSAAPGAGSAAAGAGSAAPGSGSATP